MQKLVFSILLLCVFFLPFISCNNKNEQVNEKKFFSLYEEILTIRADEPDTAIANPKVRELFEKHNYSQEQFKLDFMKLSEDNENQRFAKKIDSLRQYVLGKQSFRKERIEPK